jgi:hypothetical protein
MNLNDKTPLAIQPDFGIQLNLSNYYRIRTWQGGGEFWEHNNQQLIRDALGQFLPRATVDGGNHVLFQHFESGKEICSQSQPVSATNSLPREQLDQLRSALIAFKAKTQDPHCDPEARKLIDCFRLPDPQKDPELYRIYGNGKNKRLIVLWGAEKEVDSAVTPLQAINMVQTDPVGAGKGKGKSLFVVGFLVLLALLGLFLWQLDKEKTLASVGGSISNGSPDQGAPYQNERDKNKGGLADSANIDDQSSPTTAAKINEKGAQPRIVGDTTKEDEGKTGVAGDFAAKKPSDIAAGNAGDPSSNPKSGDPSMNPLLNDAKSQDRPSTDKTATKGNDPKISQLAESDKKDVASENNKDGQPSNKSSSALTNTGKSTKLDSENASNTAPPAPAMKDKDSEAIVGSKSDELPNKKNDPAAAAGGLSPEPGNTASKSKDAPKPGSTNTAELTETKMSIKETTQLDPATLPASLSDESDVPATLKSGELEIKAEVGEDPRDGRVEVTLGLQAQNANLEDIKMSRATWLLDGIEIKGQDGKTLNDLKVSRWLPVGKHTLSVVGRTKDGQEMHGEAQLDVRIRQQPKPEIDIKNSPPSKNK